MQVKLKISRVSFSQLLWFNNNKPINLLIWEERKKSGSFIFLIYLIERNKNAIVLENSIDADG